MDMHHSGGMIALLPTPGNTDRLSILGGEPAPSLHLTLCYLGEASEISRDVRAQLIADVQRLAERQTTPIVADGFGVGLFNPHRDDMDTCVVLLLTSPDLVQMRDKVKRAVNRLGDAYSLPDQYEPWIPHVTLAYTDDTSITVRAADRPDFVTFDRFRITFGGESHDFMFGGMVGRERVEPIVSYDDDVVDGEMSSTAMQIPTLTASLKSDYNPDDGAESDTVGEGTNE